MAGTHCAIDSEAALKREYHPGTLEDLASVASIAIEMPSQLGRMVGGRLTVHKQLRWVLR
ncbi:hypothetical protein BJX96DRAFT_158981 [Aspergillus floccosus]